MKAVILAGGKGTRLRPYTVSFPKPLVPVGDYPILEVIIRQLKRQGFTDITVSTGHLAELIRAYFGDGSAWGVSIDYLYESVPLNTAGALGMLETDAEHILAMNGDVLTTLDYAAFVEEHIRRGAAASVATKARQQSVDFGVVETNAEGMLGRWIEKPVYDFQVSMGVYVLSRRALDMIEPGESLGMPDLLVRLVEAGEKVYCHRSDCEWLDIGRVDDYGTAQEIFEADAKRYLGADD